MNSVDSTPEMAAAVYRRMAENLEIVRRRLGRPLTLADKILLGHLDQPETQDLVPGESYLALRPDRVAFQDVLGQTGMLQFMQTGLDRVAVPTTIHCDHLIRARDNGAADLDASLRENREVYDFLRAAAARYGAGFWGPVAGIIHQVILETYAFPGALIIGTDSHTPNAGGADAVEMLAGLAWELLYPRRIAVHLTGRLGGWTAPKDVILRVAGELAAAGATNAVIEYIGLGTASLSATGKATIANMGAELGATTSLFPFDARMAVYLEATGRGDLAIQARRAGDLLAADAEADSGFVDGLSAALVGSCTNSSYEDMSRAADVARQVAERGAAAAVPLLVTPGSERVRATIERDGQMRALETIGATVLANACGPCIGQWRRQGGSDAAANSIVSSYNRNFPGRNDSRPTTMNFIASPEVVTALAIAGRLSFNPMTDDLIGADGGVRRADAYLRGTAAGRFGARSPDRAGQRSPATPAAVGALERRGFHRLARAGQDPGQDDATDQISPAGPWLALRGHLERFSDNLLMGAVNAFTGEAGKGTDQLSGAEGLVFSAVACRYRAKGRGWVIVGDANYGEGCSREHAALSPRLFGGVAVIARSFARIHETNLKKQGLLALTFDDPDDYDRILEGDRISLTDLRDLAPGRPVACRIDHADGSAESLALRHSHSQDQLAWFRAGSALNLLRAGGEASSRVA